jgi:hypothetical protein
MKGVLFISVLFLTFKKIGKLILCPASHPITTVLPELIHPG